MPCGSYFALVTVRINKSVDWHRYCTLMLRSSSYGPLDGLCGQSLPRGTRPCEPSLANQKETER